MTGGSEDGGGKGPRRANCAFSFTGCAELQERPHAVPHPDSTHSTRLNDTPFHRREHQAGGRGAGMGSPRASPDGAPMCSLWHRQQTRRTELGDLYQPSLLFFPLSSCEVGAGRPSGGHPSALATCPPALSLVPSTFLLGVTFHPCPLQTVDVKTHPRWSPGTREPAPPWEGESWSPLTSGVSEGQWWWWAGGRRIHAGDGTAPACGLSLMAHPRLSKRPQLLSVSCSPEPSPAQRCRQG